MSKGHAPNGPEPAGAPRAAAPRLVLIAVGLAGVAVFLTFVHELRDVVAPVFLGLNLMIAAFPLQRWLSVRIHRYAAAVLTLLLVLAVLGFFFTATGWAAGELVRELPGYNAELRQLWIDAAGWLAGLGVSEAMLMDQFRGIEASSVLGLLTPLVANVSSVLAVLVTVVMAVFFLSMDSTSIQRRMAMLGRGYPGAAAAMSSFSHGVRRYWIVTTVFGLIVALLDVVILAIIGVPLIWVWGVLAFLTNYIPNIGFVIGLAPPALLALLDGGPGPALAVVAAYSVLNFSVQSIVQPKFTGQSVGVTPTVSFLSLLFWYWVLGWLGALLALPATLLLKAVLIDADPRARWVNALISSNPEREVPPAMRTPPAPGPGARTAGTAPGGGGTSAGGRAGAGPAAAGPAAPDPSSADP
ncbi:AI-2E family transporter [Arthrobacter halodurans]|uniref:AI-2E family transporter n=1 Tax=Arthrobacter halodurans TaxID=516699 RepID=A0ABV4UJQ1_9MICC